MFTIIILTIFGSILSLFGGTILLIKRGWDQRFAYKLTSFAAGVLLATAFLDLFPEAYEFMKEFSDVDITTGVFLPAFFGIIIFFLLERSLLWFHHHHEVHDLEPTVWMITLGDSLHNFIDGVAIASAYLAHPSLAFTTAIAVAAHEIPQEIADFSILLTKKLSKWKALQFNLYSSFTALFGAILTYFLAPQITPYLNYIISFTAGMFAYIALSDLIPELHHGHSQEETLPQLFMFIVGISLVLLLGKFIHF